MGAADEPNDNLRISIIIINLLPMYFPYINNPFCNMSLFFYPGMQNAYPTYYQEAEPIAAQNHTEIVAKIQNEENCYKSSIKKQALAISILDLKEAGYEKKKNAWNQEEDAQLLNLANLNISWSNISKEMKGRSIKMCYSRYKRLIKNQQSDEKIRYWTKAEDQKLVQLIEKFGKSWKQLSSFFNDRKPKQLRQRYVNTLMPNISKEPWTLEEDLKLIELFNKHGKKWKKIAKQLKDRSENQVKNRYYGRILPLQKKKKTCSQQNDEE